MVLSLSFSCTGDQIGTVLADDAEEAADALVELSRRVDLAELTDYVEQRALAFRSTLYETDKLYALAAAINEGLKRAGR